MNRSQKRNQLIQYFFAISHHQEQIQNIQNQIVSHLRFNPLVIFKKLSDGSNHLTFDQLKNYIRHEVQIKDSELIKKYFFKHFTHKVIKLDEFSASILPYTPNVLRQATQKIQKQMQTKHFDKLIQQLYLKLLQNQLKSIHQICVLQKDINFDWTQLKKFINKDITELGKRIDSYLEESCSIVNVRKWMELWVEVDQYQILNIMRWFGGFEEKHIKRIYQNNIMNLKCTCSNHYGNPNESVKNLKQTEISKHQTPSQKLNKVKSESKILKDSKYLLATFFKYVETIIKSERRLNILREGIKPYRKEIQQILHQVTSKKFPSTRLGKIIEQMQTVILLKEDVIQTLMKQLQNTKVDNNFIFSLFASSSKKTKAVQPIKKEDLLSQMFEVLYTFCLSKATLKSLSRELYNGTDTLFRQLDENRHGLVDSTDLKLILNDCDIKFKQEDIAILMIHFGDGQKITKQSLKEVIQIQRSN